LHFHMINVFLFLLKIIVCLTIFKFLPRDASAERSDATVSRLSVCLSVRLSVRNDQVP